MIRIAYVIPTLDQSGAERQLTLLATGLPRVSYSVRVIALQRGGPYLKTLTDAGIDVRVLHKRFRLDPLTLYQLRRELRSFQPHIVQSFLFAASSYVRLPGVTPTTTKIVVSERCVDSWKSDWQLSLDRHQIPRMHAMTANSNSVADFYSGIGVPRDLITVIPNAQSITESRYSRQQSREILGLKNEHRVLGFVGRLAPQKRLHDVIWAFQLLHQLVDNARLVLVGSGPERDTLSELARSFGCRDRIVFAGHREDASSLMTAFDAFVLGSDFEGMSNSLMEAMSMGLPCIASDIPPNRELITDGETGILFPVGKAPDLAKLSARVLTDVDLANRLGQAARHHIANNYKVEQMVTAHESLYRRLSSLEAP